MINVAIIGTGAISDSHIEAYLAYPERCRIVALVDVNLEKALEKIDAWKLDSAVAFTDYHELYNLKNKPSLASICLPPALHYSISCDLLRGKINVLCEKPLAPSLEECDLMLEAAKEAGVILSSVAQNRFKPDVVKVRRLAASGLLGRLNSIIATSLWWRGENYYNLSWRGKWETEGGGCTLIHGIHHIDLMLSIMGPVSTINALAANRDHTNSEVEDISAALITFESGAVGVFITSILHCGEEQRLIIDGHEASIELPLKYAANSQLENGFPGENAAKAAEIKAYLDSITTDVTGHTAQIDDMLYALENNTVPSVTGEDGRRAVEFISAVYQSAFTKTTVKLPITKSDPFYTKAGIVAGSVKFYKKTISIEGYKDNKIQVGGTL